MMAVWDVSRQTQVLFPATGTVTVEPALLVTWNCQSPKARALLRVAMVAIKRARDLCIFLLRMGRSNIKVEVSIWGETGRERHRYRVEVMARDGHWGETYVWCCSERREMGYCFHFIMNKKTLVFKRKWWKVPPRFWVLTLKLLTLMPQNGKAAGTPPFLSNLKKKKKRRRDRSPLFFSSAINTLRCSEFSH